MKQPPEPKTNSLALASMIIGIVCIVIPFLPIIPPALAVIFGFIALSQINQTGEEGKGMAIAGIVTGFVSILFTIIIGILIFVAASATVNTINHNIEYIEESMGEACYASGGFGCSDAKLDNDFLSFSIQNSQSYPVSNLEVEMTNNADCPGRQPLGTLQSGEEKTIIFFCQSLAYNAEFTIYSDDRQISTGRINIG